MPANPFDYPQPVKETDNYVEYPVRCWRSGDTNCKRRENKFLCLGGPFHGEFWTRSQLSHACPGYKEFNNAASSRHRVIFAWTEED